MSEHILYNGEIVLNFQDNTHRYYIDGVPKQGVTSVIKILAKDGLIQWAANMVCDFIRLNCQTGGTYTVTEEHLKEAKYAHTKRRDDAADVGKQVHKWIELHIGGRDTEVSTLMRPSIDAFLKWEAEAKPKYLSSERVVYSKRYDYCGTTDVMMLLDGKRTILDFKTGKPDEEYKRYYTGRKRARTEHFIQDAAYDIAINEEDGEGAEQYAVLYLPLTGDLYLYITDQTELYRELFQSILQTSRLLKQANFTNEYSKGGKL